MILFMRKTIKVQLKNGLIETFIVTEFRLSNHIFSMKLSDDVKYI